MYLIVLGAALLAPFVPAQQQPSPVEPLTLADFMPPNHQTIAAVDLEALRDRGIWDELAISILGPVLNKMFAESGLSLETLDRATMILVGDAGSETMPSAVTVFEGHEPVGPPPWLNSPRWGRERIGDFECRVREASANQHDPQVVAWPTPRMRVEGGRSLVAPALEGKPTRGKPSGDVMSLLSGRGDNLAYFVMALETEAVRTRVLGVLGAATWPREDPPTFLMLRLRAVGDGEEPHLEVAAVVRHRKGAEGLSASETAARTWLDGLAAHPRLGALKATWNKVQLSRSGPDLVARVDLGRPRHAIGTLAQLAAPLFLGAVPEAVPAGEKGPGK